MKNKGFTLIEMLGVMTLLAIIFALVYPNAMEMLDKSKKQDYIEYERTIILATEAYVNANDISMPITGETVTVTFSELMNSNYLSTNVMNPKTKKLVSNVPDEKVVIAVDSAGKYIYTIGGS